MNKKFFLILFWFVLIIGSITAAETFLGTFKVSTPINLIQTCANCTYVNITSVLSPTSVLVLNETVMEKIGYRYNYTLPGQTLTGTYQVCGVGDPDGTATVWCYAFDVTLTGEEEAISDPDNRKTSIIIALVAVIIYFTVFGFMAFSSDIGKASFWLSAISFSMGFIELMFLLGVIYLNETGINIGTILYVNFISMALVGLGVGLTLVWLIVSRLISLDKTDEKWTKKW